ncbi:28S ribosomal protein S24, mitochondrial [Phasianus colchicus]|uniref:28S ribosomal protein S24, mitochondrial n=1 Tax=Phasianus colchicus TaxID=9054 RepID=UPI00129E6F5D|nr:28S ribosomal protein S24, mitochondrial [Phasianus colchicus]
MGTWGEGTWGRPTWGHTLYGAAPYMGTHPIWGHHMGPPRTEPRTPPLRRTAHVAAPHRALAPPSREGAPPLPPEVSPLPPEVPAPNPRVKMAAPTALRALRALPHSRTPALPASRSLHPSPPCMKARAARVRVGKGDKAVSYERAHPPHHIAHRKGWLSLHTGNLAGEPCAARRSVEDAFLRRFVGGTFPGCLADEVVLKRRANALLLCLLLLRRLPPAKLCFLLGYSEALLARLYKCPVRLQVQTLPGRVPYKFL